MSLQNVFGELSLEETNKAILYFLARLADTLPRTDALDRQVVALEATGNSVAVASLPTLANVTTLATLTNAANLAAMGGIPVPFAAQNMGMPFHIYNNIVVS